MLLFMKVIARDSHIEGKGVFATEPIAAGECIYTMSGTEISEEALDELLDAEQIRFDDPFEIGGGKYLLLDPLPVLTNHSCEPNAGIRGTNELFALRDIATGEEITFDYATTVGRNGEGQSDWELPCLCNTPSCRKIVGNWLTLPKERLAFFKEKDALPTFVLAQLAEIQD